jgi:hypothetical protein
MLQGFLLAYFMAYSKILSLLHIVGTICQRLILLKLFLEVQSIKYNKEGLDKLYLNKEIDISEGKGIV